MPMANKQTKPVQFDNNEVHCICVVKGKYCATQSAGKLWILDSAVNIFIICTYVYNTYTFPFSVQIVIWS